MILGGQQVHRKMLFLKGRVKAMEEGQGTDDGELWDVEKTERGRVGRGVVFEEEKWTCLELVGSLRRPMMIKVYFMALSCMTGAWGSLK